MKQPNSASNGDICGGVFVSLNGPVDFNTLPLDPKFDLESGKPYIYIDCMKEQYPDAQCLMKVNFIPQFEYLLKYGYVTPQYFYGAFTTYENIGKL